MPENDLNLPPLRHPLPGLDDDERGARVSEEDAKIRNILENEDYAGASLEIARKSETGTWGYISSVLINDWNDEVKRSIANEFGGGEYRAKVRTTSGAFGQSFKFTIDRAVKPKPVPATSEPMNPMDMLKQAKALTGDSTTLMMQMMQQAQATQMQFMQMMMAQQAKSAEMMITMMARPAQPVAPQNDRIMELLLAKVLNPPAPVAPPAPMDLEKMIEVVAKLRDLTAANGEGAKPEKETDFFGDVMKALPSILKTISSIRIPQMQPQVEPARLENAGAPAQVVQEPATGAAPIPPAPSPAEVAGANKAALAQFLPQLVDAAVTQTDTKQMADTISGIMDDAQFSGIVTLLQRDDWLAVLSDAHPPVMTHSNWFIALRRELIALVEDDGDNVIELAKEQPAGSV